MPRQSPLEEGEHAGDTDDDVMMIDEVDNKGRSSGGRRDIGRGRRSRSRSDSRGKKGKRRRTKSRSRSRDRLDDHQLYQLNEGRDYMNFSGTGGEREAGAGSRG